MERRRRDCCILFVGLLFLSTQTQSATVRRAVRVGVILDLSSPLGDMVRSCINIALQDFYDTYDSSTTNLQLHFYDSGNDLLTAASAAWDLINNKKVDAILGPQNSEQARFVVELGNRSDVPVIWFSPSGPSLLPPRSRFFIHSNSTRSHCSQFQAIAAMIEAYNWQSVIPIYEEPEFGNDLIPCLTYALQDMDTRLPYISAIRQNFTEAKITDELNKIIKEYKRTYVFLAHMTVELWSRLVEQAQNVGLMNEGYAWILTQGLSSALDPEALDQKAKGYMDGALGVRPSLRGTNITRRLNLVRRYDNKTRLSLYGLWAYDAITALAYAVENSSIVYSTSRYRNETGPELRKAIQDTDFRGLSGNFSLRQGQVEPSRVAVYNVKGQIEHIIGHWSPETGLVRYPGAAGEVIWPGNTTERPPKLKIGVPKTHFTEFVNVSVEGEHISATGFAVDVFQKVVALLSFPYEFVPVNHTNGELTPSGYDEILCDIANQTVDVDVIIGDITILEGRTDCVDFTLPYLDSSVSMVVKVRSESKNGWILLKPFDWLLWLILGVIFVSATVIVIILERKRTKNDAESEFIKHLVRNPFLIYMSDVGSLKSGTSKWVVIVVVFLLGIAVQIYTANLTSILSERTTAKPSPWRDIQEIKRNKRSVGYQNDSWVKSVLTKQMRLEEVQLKPLGSRKQYKEALLNEDKKGVDVIIDETPYLMLLLSECSFCKMTGPIYKTGGFAFAFPKNSALVSDFSAAILNVTQNVATFRDMKKSISLPVTIDKSEYKSDVETRSLTKDDFGGLFPIVFSALIFFFILSILKVITSIAIWLHNKFVSFLSPSGGVILIKS